MAYTADPTPRTLKVKSDRGKHLLTFDPLTRTIEIVKRGETYLIPLWLIEEHLRTSQRDTITVYSETKEESLPCGHTEGTVMDAYYNHVCAVCNQ